MADKAIDKSKRKALSSLTMAILGSAVVVGGGGSFKVFAQGDPWTEIARGIASGIAEFSQSAFKAMSEYWTKTQKENNDKVSIAKGQAEDNRIDFRIQLENMRRINSATPAASLCNKEQEDVAHHNALEGEKRKNAASGSASSVVLGNEIGSGANRGVSYLGARNGRIEMTGLLSNAADLNRKVATGEPLSQQELVAYTKVTVGTTAKLAFAPIANAAKQDASIVKSPTISEGINKSAIGAAALTFSAKIIVDTTRAQAGNFVMLDQVERQALKRIGARHEDQSYKAQISNELNEVALLAEMLRLVGENIYTMNAKFRQNQKIMAAMAMQILVNDQGASE